MYGNSSSKDMNLLYPSSVLKQEELQNREFMESDLHQHRHPQQQQLKSSLMRYRSAPSYLIENSVHSGGEGEGSEDFLHPRSSSSEAETIFERFMYCSGGGDSAPSDLCEIGKKSINQRSSQFLPLMENNEAEIVNEYSPATKMMYQTDPPPPLPNHGSSATGISYRMTNLMEMEHHPQVKTANGNCSNNLIRHSSSPAGLFSHLTVENGYPVMRGMGNFKAVNSSTNGEASPSSSRLKGQINFSHGSPPSSGLMSQISEIGSDSIDTTSPHDGSLRSNNGGNRCFIPGFQMGSWEGSTLGSENFSGLKRVRDYNEKNGDIGHQSSGLTHKFSLPKTSSEIAAMEKFLQFQDSVPCKIRAKRGCATHPRSIAERVRRTRISERMRKLQELVPNMEKQTNTSDMLDFAVEYIKDLQKQVKTLNDKRANCTCSGKQKPNSNPTVRLASVHKS